MNKEILLTVLEEDGPTGLVKRLLYEVHRLELLLEAERSMHRQTKDMLLKARHDRDRYAKRLKEEQNER